MPINNEKSASIFLYPNNVNNAIKLVEEAIADEKNDEEFYNYLIMLAPNEDEKAVISGIRNDEIKHYKMFKQVYYHLTNKPLTTLIENKFIPPANYKNALMMAIIGETDAVKKYRKILYALEDRIYINMLIEIITDELHHGILYNALLSI